jgi:signal transduction histidine kinase
MVSHAATLLVEDIQQYSHFPRIKMALECGIVSIVEVPIIAGKEVIGVCELYATQRITLQAETNLMIEEIGVQVGQVIKRLWQEESLIKAKEVAEAAAKTKSDFFSNMSHELRTPMHAILNYAKMGLKGLHSGSQENLEKYLNNIQQAGSRLLSLLNNLLDLTKMDAGKMAFDLQQGDFKAVIDYSLMELESLLLAKSLQVTVSNHSESMIAVFDKNRMIQVMVNLLSNAIKFSPPSSTIRIVLSDACLAGTASTPAQHSALCCQVTDEGIGIPAGELEDIFIKFHQSSATKKTLSGTGLGLYVCEQILRQHQGKIWAENGTTNGAIFQFILPREAFPLEKDSNK